ncbi:MAG TPA: glycosyltransferase [Bryobacteraceae bacterium]
MAIQPSDHSFLQPTFPESGGRVRMISSAAEPAAKVAHIPASNPFVTKLASLALDTIRGGNHEALYCSYFEPYGVAGHLASVWSEVPYVLEHAGSDIDRLMLRPGLASSYLQIITAADAVITRRGLLERFLRMMVRPDRLHVDVPFAVPPLFSPREPALDINSLAQSLSETDVSHIPSELRPAAKTFDPGLPTIGIYGKVGEAKGSFDLLGALRDLKQQGLKFNLLAMINGWSAARFFARVVESDLSEVTWVLPFLPHWRVPSFIRACTAVCFLERGFQIGIHGPRVPREVLACGTCLILSQEIAAKQFYAEQIVDGSNMVLIQDPRERVDLANKLRLVVDNPEFARKVGLEAATVSKNIEHFDSAIDGYERVFWDTMGKSRHDSLGKRYSAQVSPGTAARLNSETCINALLPSASQLMAKYHLSLAAAAEAEASPLAAARGVLDALTAHIQNEPEPTRSALADLLRYESAPLLMAQQRLLKGALPWFNTPDSLLDGDITRGGALHQDLRPVLSNYCIVLELQYSPEDTRELLSNNAHLLTAAPMTLLVILRPNFSTVVLKVSALTLEVIRLADGFRTIRDIESCLARQQRFQKTEEHSASLCELLVRLRSKEILVLSSSPR